MTTKDLKYFAKFDKLIENAKKIDKCRQKHCKDLIQAVENERKEYAKYITNYYEKSKAYKEFIKKKDSYRNIKDIKEQNRLNKLNVKEYHKTTEYKEFNKKTNSFINSKIKKQLDQCSFTKCPDLYRKEITIRMKTFIGDKIPIPKDFTYNDYTKIIKIFRQKVI